MLPDQIINKSSFSISLNDFFYQKLKGIASRCQLSRTGTYLAQNNCFSICGCAEAIVLRNARFVCELACGNNLICKENQIKYICFIILRECTALVVDRNAKCIYMCVHVARRLT